MFTLGDLAQSQAIGVAFFLAYLIFRKRKSTENKHKLHTLMLLVGGYGLASLTGGAIVGVIWIIRKILNFVAAMLDAWLWSFLDFIPALIRLIPDALPYALVIAIPFIVLVEVWPHKWAPRWLKGHFGVGEDHHTPKFAFLVPGIIAQIPAVAAAFSLLPLIQAASH